MQTSQKIIKLSQLQSGEIGALISDPDNPVYMQIMNMGFIPSENIIIRNVGLMGDPIAYKVRDVLITIRKSDADTLQVTLIDKEL